MTKSKFKLAVGGQIDAFVMTFVAWLQKSPEISDKPDIVIPSDKTYPELKNVSWRLGSLVSAQDTTNMLADVDVFVCFYLTPENPEKRTAEGLISDVRLLSAYNLAKQAEASPGCHTIVVTRSFPDDDRDLGEQYLFWKKIKKIFEANCSRLTFLQTEPVLSEYDALTVAMTESASVSRINSKFSHKWLNYTAPVEQGYLFSTLYGLMLHPPAGQTSQTLSGNIGMKWLQWHQLIERYLANHLSEKAAARLKISLQPESIWRKRLLEESIAFSSQQQSDEPLSDSSFVEQMQSLARFDLLGCSLYVKSVRKVQRNEHASCYVQRILTDPKRDIPAITDLLMQWLPRYFQRIVRVDSMDGNRKICRLSRIPLIELEKLVESSSRCQLLIRTPWTKSVHPVSRLIVTKTSPDESPGELLVIIEDGPDSELLTMGFRAVIHAFGKYLRDYGVGK